jgi:succinyl-diaminopimelate desuccinylase
MAGFDAAKVFLSSSINDSRNLLIHATQRLVQAASPNPPGDVSEAAAAAVALIKENIPDAEISLYQTSPGIVNVVAVIQGSQPGKTLVFSGHLDTYPIGDTAQWTVSALGGSVSDDMSRLYGRGAADMKGGIAASIISIRAIAEQKDAWDGQIVLALAGDEETMGSLGTMWLLDNVDVVKNADAAIVGDAGTPLVVRTGEKGLLWLELCATGKAAHGAHVHHGVNAIEKLVGAIGCIKDLEKLNVQGPDEVVQAIEAATPISKEFAGTGEADVLRRITLNLGTISGGTSMNLIPDFAQAKLDIRLPYGITTDELLRHIRSRLDPLQGISFHVARHYDPTWTARSNEIVGCTLSAAQDIIGPKAVINMRVGASDARLYRQRGIPTVVVGLTPFNMGGSDEYCLIEELMQVAQVHASTAFQFLGKKISIIKES